MKHFCIVIPCYNEARKFQQEDYLTFLASHHAVQICFVNDGSTDETSNHLQEIAKMYPQQVEVLELQKNQGKAEAVRQGILHVCKKEAIQRVAYIDADLAVTLEECYDMQSYLKEYNFCFGSRILRVGSRIERKFSRFLIGRIIATLISNILDLKVYDTQCGCKLIQKDLASKLFEQPFISKWLFDVELFFRMYEQYGKQEAEQKMYEIPLNQWIDKGDSKVKWTYVFRLFLDLYHIKKSYQHTLKNKA